MRFSPGSYVTIIPLTSNLISMDQHCKLPSAPFSFFAMNFPIYRFTLSKFLGSKFHKNIIFKLEKFPSPSPRCGCGKKPNVAEQQNANLQIPKRRHSAAEDGKGSIFYLRWFAAGLAWSPSLWWVVCDVGRKLEV